MIKVVQIQEDPSWNHYVFNNAKSNAYQTSHWRQIINCAYGYKTYSLAVVCNEKCPKNGNLSDRLKGILQLVHLKSPLIGTRLVSIPYFDHGGI